MFCFDSVAQMSEKEEHSVEAECLIGLLEHAAVQRSDCIHMQTEEQEQERQILGGQVGHTFLC